MKKTRDEPTGDRSRSAVTRICGILAGICVLVVVIFAAGAAAAEPDPSWSLRRGAMIDVVARAEPRRGFQPETFRLLARALDGSLTADEATAGRAEVATWLPAALERAPRRQAQVFAVFAAAQRLGHLQPFQPFRDPELVNRLRQLMLDPSHRATTRLVSWHDDPAGRGGTLNQRLLWAAAGHAVGMLFDETEQTAFTNAWLRRFAEDYLANLTWESDSTVYEVHYLEAWYLVMAVTDDPILRRIARDVLDHMLVSFAAKYVDGIFCSVGTRDKVPFPVPGMDGGLHQILQAFFGIPGTDVPGPFGRLIPAFAVDYVPPAAATALATWSGTVETEESFLSFPYLTPVRVDPRHHRQRTVFKRDGAVLGSMWYDEDEIDGAATLASYHPVNWKLCWVDDGRPGWLYLTHLDPSVQPLPRRPPLWSSLAEWTVQHRNVLASLVVVSPDQEPLIQGPVPFDAADEIETDGPWLFLRFGNRLVTVYVAGGLDLHRGRFDVDGHSIDGAIGRGTPNAIVLATYHVDDIAPGRPGEVAFRTLRDLLRREASVLLVPGPGTPALEVTWPALAEDGDLVPVTLELVYRERRTVDGRPLSARRDGPVYRSSATSAGK